MCMTNFSSNIVRSYSFYLSGSNETNLTS